ncbi:Integrase, catalytic core [Corchorus capsularis]|uniref:Integrase, catalytic core n=1 Tax=Corchorus capsularis TaxID=210143 RepID=A0A1R3GLP7_COCAP|nr:Integrase, catalytic core [Corchorus capsularis]
MSSSSSGFVPMPPVFTGQNYHLWVVKMKTYLQAHELWEKFKAWIENQSGEKIKVIRSDNDTDYTFERFEEFLATVGIDHQLTLTYSAQQNGVSGRKNKTVMEMTRLPTKALKNKTPYEAWFGQKPNVTHLRIFGSVCYARIPKAKRGKLDEKAEVGVFVGYNTRSKGYKIFNPATSNVYVNRDVNFDENAAWNWEKNEVDVPKVVSSSLQRQTYLEGEDEDYDDALVRGTRSLADVYQRPQNKNVIEVNFRTKLNRDGTINKHKAWMVVEGYAQCYGVDFIETFAHVATLDTIRLLLAIASQNQWKGSEDKVFLLKKALYGLKQALRSRYDRINSYWMQLEFNRSPSEPTLHVKPEKEDKLVVSLYVNDLLKQRYSTEILKKFHMENCKPMHSPMNQGEKLSKEDGSGKKQDTIAQSTAEAEYIAAAAAVNQVKGVVPSLCIERGGNPRMFKRRISPSSFAIWIKKLLKDLLFCPEVAVKILVDNQSAIVIAKKSSVLWQN